ncbi:hypothetical protein [Selenomonas sp. AE3005]|uniref:hypothetical protein n=1 Tax=Selenomonas sp. AE3005 TaxID=1485543 RepID=UPI0025EBAA5E|nr:hypothetical protein [Selenomonas sp. AE3005]
MIAYIYDNNRFYAGTITCQIDPLESQKQGKNVYLTPANSTNKKPTIIEGAKPRWNGKDWEQYPDDKLVYGYTENTDGTINYYGSNHLAEELQRIYNEVTLSFSDTEPVSVDGVYWLSADNPDYIEAKKAHDKAEALAQLDAQYNTDKAVLSEQYTMAMLTDDTELAEELKAELIALNEDYDKAYEEIVGGE